MDLIRAHWDELLHMAPPETYRAGWKDTAPVSEGGVTEILVRFPYSADANNPYMAHCHILEHEDSGMRSHRPGLSRR